MNKITHLLPEEDLVRLSANDLFDRIINVKLNCRDQLTENAESYVIRSDYEVIYPDSNTPIDGTIIPSKKHSYIIRRCSVKPSIKVHTKMVTSSLGTQVDLYLSNFFLLTNDGKHLMSFSSDRYVVETVEIAMGYWGQFARNDVLSSLTVEDLMEVEAKNGADKITVTDITVTNTEKLPPDAVLHIKGFVGAVYSSPVGVSGITTPQMAVTNPTASSDDDLAKILYDNITRCFLNKHYFTEGAGSALPPAKRYITVSEKNEVYFPAVVAVDPVTGTMLPAVADLYGTKVYLSEGAQKIKIPKRYDSQGNEQKISLYFESGYTIGMTLARIGSYLAEELNYTFDNNGDVLVFLPKEGMNPDELYKAFNKNKVYDNSTFSKKSLYDSKLPAVYNINIDAIATITCPFYTFLEPFQMIEFASRYALTNLVSYFANYNPAVNRFLVINYTVSFATVDDVNEVQITAVSQKEYERGRSLL